MQKSQNRLLKLLNEKKNHITQILFCSNMYQEKGWTAYKASTLQFQPPLCTHPSEVRHIFVQEERNSFSHYARLEVTVYIPVIIWEFMSLQTTDTPPYPPGLQTRTLDNLLQHLQPIFVPYKKGLNESLPSHCLDRNIFLDFIQNVIVVV